MLGRPARWAERVRRHSFTRFAVLGLGGLVFDLALLALLVRFTPLPEAAAVTVAFFVTYGLNFALNRRFAFGAEGGHVGGQLTRFAPQLAVDYLLVVAAVEALTALGLGLLAARLLAAATNGAFNYCCYRWWTFRAGAGTLRSVLARHPAGQRP